MSKQWGVVLAGCASVAAVAETFVAAIAPYGFTASACGAFVPTDKGPEPSFFFQNWPPAWISLYQARKFYAADFSVAEARRRLAPFSWREVKAQRSLSKAEQELWDTALQWGWSDGFSVPIHGPGGYLGIVTMAGGRTPTASQRDELHLLALHTHERCRVLSRFNAVTEPAEALTQRELECMRWVAAGKTDAETAIIVGLSRETVKGYVDSARHKLGAGTRPQAVARLVLAGL